jgi:type I restriction-modification system DNA methylase subunit
MFESLQGKYNLWSVFTDWLEMASITFENIILKDPEKEKRYLEIYNKYSKKEKEIFPKILGELIMAFDKEYEDHLGKIYMEMSIYNKGTGQFFTPYNLSKLTAQLVGIEEKSTITIDEPAVGSGGMVIAYAEHLLKKGINPQSKLIISASDKDINCVRMSHIQLSILGLRAKIFHRDTLAMNTWKVIYTPFYYAPASSYAKRKEPETNKEGVYKLFQEVG